MQSVIASYTWAFYAGLAVAALFVSWRNFDLRPVGVALVMSCAGSNAAHYWLPVLERPAAYTVAEAFVLSMAFLANVCGASRRLVVVVAVCIVSIGLNVHITMIDRPSLPQIAAWELGTNLCFGVECVLVLSVGLYDRTRDWLAHGRARFALHGRKANPTETSR